MKQLKKFLQNIKEHDLFDAICLITIIIFLGFSSNKSIKNIHDYFYVSILTSLGLWFVFLSINLITYLIDRRKK